MDNSSLEKLEKEILDLINKEIEITQGLVGINVGTHGGTLVASKHERQTNLSEEEIASATSSLLFLSRKMLKDSLNQSIAYHLIAGKEIFLLTFMTKNLSMIAFLNRKIADLEGLELYISKLKELALKMSAIIETSVIMKDEIFIKVKRTIPNALVIAIISKDGLPIQIQSTMEEPMIAAMISAIYNLSDILLEGGLEFSIIAGENGSIIIHELDHNRVLCVAVPEAEEHKLGSYVVKIKGIIEH